MITIIILGLALSSSELLITIIILGLALSSSELLITIIILGLALSSSELEFHKFKEAYGKRYAKADEKLR